eukprot:TRINITY_DN16758_c0_g1_i1.p1 TRINITY_DN16758_c0_g1~~TRINITY_DN16758_c0_g1_i1.p1  ORF type:complete len:281 (-),score=47.71 TRINITY_DN16758_c0_g1_i1:162-1004(-)
MFSLTVQFACTLSSINFTEKDLNMVLDTSFEYPLEAVVSTQSTGAWLREIQKNYPDIQGGRNDIRSGRIFAAVFDHLYPEKINYKKIDFSIENREKTLTNLFKLAKKVGGVQQLDPSECEKWGLEDVVRFLSQWYSSPSTQSISVSENSDEKTSNVSDVSHDLLVKELDRLDQLIVKTRRNKAVEQKIKHLMLDVRLNTIQEELTRTQSTLQELIEENNTAEMQLNELQSLKNDVQSKRNNLEEEHRNLIHYTSLVRYGSVGLVTLSVLITSYFYFKRTT